jgi:hypothetical protein
VIIVEGAGDKISAGVRGMCGVFVIGKNGFDAGCVFGS